MATRETLVPGNNDSWWGKGVWDCMGGGLMVPRAAKLVPGGRKRNPLECIGYTEYWLRDSLIGGDCRCAEDSEKNFPFHAF